VVTSESAHKREAALAGKPTPTPRVSLPAQLVINAPLRSSNRSFDLLAGIHSLFVYCDIVKNAIVGDTYSPLLRAIEIPNKPFGTDCAIQFTEIFFQPLNFRQIDSIEISIRDDTNTLIDFKFGKTLLLLLLKKDE